MPWTPMRIPFPLQIMFRCDCKVTQLQQLCKRGGGEIEKEQNFPLFQGFCLSVVSNA